MRITYDESVDIIDIRLRESDYEESDQVATGVIVDFDKDGKLIAIEILDASDVLGQIDRVMLEQLPI